MSLKVHIAAFAAFVPIVTPSSDESKSCDAKPPLFELSKRCVAQEGSWGYFENGKTADVELPTWWTGEMREKRVNEWNSFHDTFTKCSDEEKYDVSDLSLLSYDLLKFPTMSKAGYEGSAPYAATLGCNANVVKVTDGGDVEFVCGHEEANLAKGTDILINPKHANLRSKCLWKDVHGGKKTLECPSIKFTLEELKDVHRIHALTPTNPTFKDITGFFKDDTPTFVPLFSPEELFVDMPSVKVSDRHPDRQDLNLLHQGLDSGFTQTLFLSVKEFFEITGKLDRMATIQFMVTPKELEYIRDNHTKPEEDAHAAFARWAMEKIVQHGIKDNGFTWARPDTHTAKTIRVGFHNQEFGDEFIKQSKARNISPAFLSFTWIGTCDLEKRMKERDGQDPKERNSYEALPEEAKRSIYLYNTFVEKCKDKEKDETKTNMEKYYEQGVRAFTVPLTWLVEGTNEEGLQLAPDAKKLLRKYSDVYLYPFALERGTSNGGRELSPFWPPHSPYNVPQSGGGPPIDNEENYQYLTMIGSVFNPRDNILILKYLFLDVGSTGVYSDHPHTVSSFANCVLPGLYNKEAQRMVSSLIKRLRDPQTKDEFYGDLLEFLKKTIGVDDSELNKLPEDLNQDSKKSIKSIIRFVWGKLETLSSSGRNFLARLKLFTETA